MREIPELYDVARNICHDNGWPWTDPRTGVTYPPPKEPMDDKDKMYTITLPHDEMMVLVSLNMLGMASMRGDREPAMVALLASKVFSRKAGDDAMIHYEKTMGDMADTLQIDAELSLHKKRH